MTAGEDELQSLVRKSRGLHRHLTGIGRDKQTELRGEGPVAADSVRSSVPSRRHQPGARVAGDPVARPSVGGDRKGFLRGFLCEVKVAEEADQGGQHAAPLLAEDPIERRWCESRVQRRIPRTEWKDRAGCDEAGVDAHLPGCECSSTTCKTSVYRTGATVHDEASFSTPRLLVRTFAGRHPSGLTTPGGRKPVPLH